MLIPPPVSVSFQKKFPQHRPQEIRSGLERRLGPRRRSQLTACFDFAGRAAIDNGATFLREKQLGDGSWLVQYHTPTHTVPIHTNRTPKTRCNSSGWALGRCASRTGHGSAWRDWSVRSSPLFLPFDKLHHLLSLSADGSWRRLWKRCYSSGVRISLLQAKQGRRMGREFPGESLHTCVTSVQKRLKVYLPCRAACKSGTSPTKLPRSVVLGFSAQFSTSSRFSFLCPF